MDTLQLQHILLSDQLTRRQYGGVLPADRVPDRIPGRPIGYIVNTDPSTLPGRHWVAFHFPADSKQPAIFWDSYGRGPNSYNASFTDFLNKNSEQWTYNKRTLQGAYSTVCGQYCVYFLLKMARHVPLSNIVAVFSHDKKHNDFMINQFIRHHFHINSHVKDRAFMSQQLARALYTY